MSSSSDTRSLKKCEKSYYYLRPHLEVEDVEILTKRFWLDPPKELQLPPLVNVAPRSNQVRFNWLQSGSSTVSPTHEGQSTTHSNFSSISSDSTLVEGIRPPTEISTERMTSDRKNLSLLADVTTSAIEHSQVSNMNHHFDSEILIKLQNILNISRFLKEHYSILENSVNLTTAANFTTLGNQMFTLEPMNGLNVGQKEDRLRTDVRRILEKCDETFVNRLDQISADLRTNFRFLSWVSSIWEEEERKENNNSISTEKELPTSQMLVLPSNNNQASYHNNSFDQSKDMKQGESSTFNDSGGVSAPSLKLAKDPKRPNGRRKKIQKQLASKKLECQHCGETETPEWRRGPYGTKSICNACGLFYKKLKTKFGTEQAADIMNHRKVKQNSLNRVIPSTLEELNDNH